MASIPTSNSFRVLQSESSSVDSHEGGPISVDEFLEMGGPISIDEFLESEREARAHPYKDNQVLSVSAATESVKTGFSASPPASPPVSPVPTPNLADIAASDSSEAPYESDSAEFREYRDNQSDVVTPDSSEAPYESDSVAFCEYGDNQNGHTTEIAGSTYNESDDAAPEEIEVDSNHSSLNSCPIVNGRAIAPEVEAQEWTYEEHKEQRRKDREQRRKDRYETAEWKRVRKVIYLGVFLLVLEVVAASIAVNNYQELVECCGNSIFSENEAVGERWNKIFRWVGIIYIPFIILIEIPTLIIAQETLFVFNPLIGYLLALQMLFSTDLLNAYIIFGLEAAAMLGQTSVLSGMRRSAEGCVHSFINYMMAGITVYMLVSYSQRGGYCIVGNRIQSIFADQTCNVACIDEESCFRCSNDGDESFLPHCFIRFPDS